MTANCRFRHFELSRVRGCEFYVGNDCVCERARADRKKDLTIEITDERNALERVMLNLAHFERQTERIDEKRYRLRMKYYESEEREIVIRILSFGSCVRVIEPKSFAELIKERLILQKRW